MGVRKLKAAAVCGVLAAMLALAASAGANRVTFLGEPARGHFIGFDLVGQGCPKGPHCFDHARVLSFEVTVYSFPNCPQILDNFINFDTINKRGVPVHKQGHTFSGSGADQFHIQLTFQGRFIHHGLRAEGWYKIDEGPCTTGRRSWSIPIHRGK